MHKQQAPRTNIYVIVTSRSRGLTLCQRGHLSTNFHKSTLVSSPHVASSVTPWTRSRQLTHHSVTIQVAHNVHHPTAALHLVRPEPQQIGPHFNLSSVEFQGFPVFLSTLLLTHSLHPAPDHKGGSQSPQPSSHQVSPSSYKTPLYLIISGLLQSSLRD